MNFRQLGGFAAVPAFTYCMFYKPARRRRNISRHLRKGLKESLCSKKKLEPIGPREPGSTTGFTFADFAEIVQVGEYRGGGVGEVHLVLILDAKDTAETMWLVGRFLVPTGANVRLLLAVVPWPLKYTAV